jgi:acetyl-CoA synthetase
LWGIPHELKGQSIYAYVTLKSGVEKSDELKRELVAHVGPSSSHCDPEKIRGPTACQDPERQDHCAAS